MHHRPAAAVAASSSTTTARAAAAAAAAATAAAAAGSLLRARSTATTAATTAMAGASATMAAVRVPVAETVAGRRLRFVELEHNRVRAVVVHDPAASFGAVAAVVQTGYLSDGSAATTATAPAPEDANGNGNTDTKNDNADANNNNDRLALHGLAHFLEHAVHLGSLPFPGEADYKQHLAKHGGSSNASTSAATTRYHARCAAAGLEGAVARLGAALASPLLKPESLAREVENVHAEFSRNRNSDSRRALQLSRSSLGPPLSGFSTGSIETLRDAPSARGVDVASAMRALWRAGYVGPAVTAAVVGPQPVEELEAMVRGAFTGVRPSAQEEEEKGGGGGGGEQGAAAADAAAAAAAAAPPGGYVSPSLQPSAGRTLAASCFPAASLGRIARVAPMRELRQLELTWHVPYSSLGEKAGSGSNSNINSPALASAAVSPWAWAAHVVGHEAAGSAAELLKRQGLITSLTAGVCEDVRLSPASPLLAGAGGGGGGGGDNSNINGNSNINSNSDTGLMKWHVSVDLTAAGDARAEHVAATLHRAVQLLRRAPEAEWERTWRQAARCAELRFEYRDRAEVLGLALGLAAAAAHYPPERVMSGPALFEGPFDASACRAFLDRLDTPGALTVTHVSPQHRGKAPETERWYGAKHASSALPDSWLSAMRAYAAVDDEAPEGEEEEDKEQAAAAATGAGDFAPRRGELFLPLPAPWALPQDLALREEAAAPAVDPAAAASEQTATAAATDPTAPTARRPELVYASPGLHVWHALDAARFGVPKAQFRVRLVTPATYAAGPSAAVRARLLARVLDDVLEPMVYDAQVAGSSVELSTELDGMSLYASGFSDVLPRLVERALGAARSLSLSVVEARFPRMAGQLRRDLLNWAHSNPQAHAEYAAERALQPGKHHAEELLAALCGDEAARGAFAAATAAQEEGGAKEDEAAAAGTFAVTPADVLSLCRAVFGCDGDGDDAQQQQLQPPPPPRAPLHADALLYGNLSREEAAGVAASLERLLQPPGIPHGDGGGGGGDGAPPASLWPTLPVVDLSTVPAAARSLSVRNPNPANANHAMVMLTQVPPASAPAAAAAASPSSAAAAKEQEEDESQARQSALLDLFVQASSKACFHELRTVRRLGYAVSLYSASYGSGGRPAHAHAPAVVDAAAAAEGASGDEKDNDGSDDADDPLRPRPIKHMAIRVQSPGTEPEALAAAAKEWLASFRAALEGMPEADLQAHRAALVARYLEPARSLADAASRCWRPVRSSRRDWGWRERKARAAGALGRDDLLAFYDAHLDPARSAAMVVMVKGGGGGTKAEGERPLLLRPPPLAPPASFFFGDK